MVAEHHRRLEHLGPAEDVHALAVGDEGSDVGLWDTASRQRIATLSEGSTVNSVAFSPNGQTLAVGENSGTIVLVDEIVWNWNFTSLKLLLCGEVGTNMTKAQWLANVPDQPYLYDPADPAKLADYTYTVGHGLTRSTTSRTPSTLRICDSP